MKNKTKTFDCVDMMHKAALIIYERTKDMTFEEEKAFWQEKNRKAKEELVQGEKGQTRSKKK